MFCRHNSPAEKLTSFGNGKFPPFPGYFLRQGLGFVFTIDLFQSTQVAGCLGELPRAWRKFTLAFLLVILQVKGILICISQSDLAASQG